MPPQESDPQGVPHDVAAIRQEIRAFLDTSDANGRKVGNAKWGVYAFPPSIRGSIIPSGSERKVSKGLRRTLMTQARRLERLVTQRYDEISGSVPLAKPGEEV